jgi:hypothetical protein
VNKKEGDKRSRTEILAHQAAANINDDVSKILNGPTNIDNYFPGDTSGNSYSTRVKRNQDESRLGNAKMNSTIGTMGMFGTIASPLVVQLQVQEFDWICILL